MAASNPIILPLLRGINKYAIPCVPKGYSGGTNLSKTLLWARFYNAGAGELHGTSIMPNTFDGAAAITAVAILSTPVAGAAGEGLRFEFGYRALALTESTDYASWQQQVAVSQDVSGWTAKTSRSITFTLTAGNFAALDYLEYYLKRDPAHADDDHNQDVDCHLLYLYPSF